MHEALPDLNVLADPAIVVDPDNYAVVAWNAAAEASYGTPEAHVTRCYELIHGRSEPCAAPGCPCPLACALNRSGPCREKHVFRDAEGRHRHMRVQANPLCDSAGQPRRILEIHTDVTEQTGELERLAQTFEHSSQAILITDAQGVIQRINPAFTRITGYTEVEAIGQKPGFRASGYHGPEFYEALWDELTSKGYWEGEIWNRRKDGHIYPEWEAISCIRNETGEIDHFMAVFHDLGEQKSRERELDQYRAVFEAARDAVLLHDSAGRFFDCNPAAVALFGAAHKQDLVGLHPADLSPTHQADGRPSMQVAEERMQEAFREGAVTFDWISQSRQGNEFPTQVTLSRVDLAGEPALQAVVRDMSEQRAAEAKRKALIDILEATPDFIATAAPDGTILYLNRAARELTGLPPATDPLGRDIPPHVQGLAGQWGHPEWAARKVREEGFPTAMRDGFWQAETALCKANGEEIPVSQIIVAHQGPEGTARLSTIMRDISEQRRAEAAVRRSQAELAEAQRVARLGSWTWESDTDALTWSDEAYRIFGVSEDAFAGTYDACLMHVHPEDRALVREQINRIARGETDTLDFRHRIVRPDGAIRHVHERALVTRHEDGRLKLTGTMQDITERVQQERELQQAARVFETSQEGIIITDADTRILQVNAAFTRITGYAEEEVVGRTPKMFQSGYHDAEFYREMWHELRAHGTWTGEIWDRRKDGAVHAKQLTINAVTDEHGRHTHYVGVFTDITELKRYQAQLEHRAYHDDLTDLPNRTLLRDRLGHALDRASRLGHQVAVLFIDLDHFKDVNDSLGHSAGDQLLISVADRLQEGVRASDTVARLGGDEFTICLEEIADAGDALTSARRIVQLLEEPHELNGHSLQVPCSIGISLYPGDGTTVEELLRNADAALYLAKESGRSAIRFYTEDLTARAEYRLAQGQDLRRAVSQGEMRLLFQPQVDMRDGRMIGVEALVRWTHPEKGTIGPDQFIPLAEEMGLIGELGDWVLGAACRTLREWLDAGYDPGQIAVNVSPHQLRDRDFPARVAEHLEEHRLAPGRLELELTESAVMDATESTLDALAELRALGVELAVDDFGTGYSSLLNLRQLPISALKIDKRFIEELSTSQDARTIVRAIISLAQALQLKVIAEGVENPKEQAFLLESGATLGQGFLWGHPTPMPLDFQRAERPGT